MHILNFKLSTGKNNKTATTVSCIFWLRYETLDFCTSEALFAHSVLRLVNYINADDNLLLTAKHK